MKRAHLTIMIKPSSSACNLACDYCFYLDEARNRTVGCHPFMETSTADAIIEKSLAEASHCTFAFQGGEPSLIGLDYFRHFVKKVRETKEKESEISYAFQTNGLLLDEEWAAFFRENNFLVGISFDGNPRVHDLHRRDTKGEKTGRRVAASIDLMKRSGVDFNVLSVVTEDLALNIEPVFAYLVNHDIRFHQYIACMNPLRGGRDFLSPAVYGEFLKRLFDLWYARWREGRPVSIRFFDNLAGMVAGYPPESCDMRGVCSVEYVAEANGDIYPCDFFCMDDYRLGNIRRDSFSTMDERRKAIRFIEDSPNRDGECVKCRWRSLCRGGCRRNREGGKFRFCSSYKTFFPYAIDRLALIGKNMRAGI